MQVFDYLDQSKVLYQYDWSVGHVRAMAVPLLATPDKVCQISADLITFTTGDYPPEDVIDQSLSRPLDRCSTHFGQVKKKVLRH